MSTDQARTIAFNPAAPQDERTDALAELQKSAMPTQVMSAEVVAQMLQFADMNKSISRNIVPFPGKNQGKPGMQSVQLDDRLLGLQGDYWEKPAAMSFDALRAMVDQTPVLNAVIMTRIRQVQSFCRVSEEGTGAGFAVRHIEKDHSVSASEKESIALLNKFFSNCGWEFNARERKKLRRDNFGNTIGKLVRDTLVLDSCAIETEFKRDRKAGMDGFTAVDGATIRLTGESGYKGDSDIFALQVIQGSIRTAYTYDDLIYEPRNPRSDILVGGYGLGETELLVRVVTGFLNAMTHNITGFDKNAIPKGVLHLSGDYSQEDLVAFRRYWNSMVKGANAQWSVPVLISKDQESKASFENFGIEHNEMAFSKWMTFLASLICAIYGMSPSEINFDSFSGGASSPLNGSDTAEKLADSKDKGLRPLLAYFENLMTDYIASDFSDKYVFRWCGLDEEDQQVKETRAMAILTVNEMRAQEGYDKMDGEIGDAPLNPSLIGPWLQMQQAAQQPDTGQPPEGGPPAKPGFGGDDDGSDFGQSQGGDDDGGDGTPDDAQDPEQDDAPDESGKPFGKAMPQSKPMQKPVNPGIEPEDDVFFNHPEHGVTSGKVSAIGGDGFTVDHELSGQTAMLWDKYLGHKVRKAKKLTTVMQGEDGMIAQDETGKRVYLHGPQDDTMQKAVALIVDGQAAMVDKLAAQAPDLNGLVESIGQVMQKSVTASQSQQSEQLSALTKAVENLSRQESHSTQMAQAFASALSGAAQKPVDLNLKLDMQAPERKPITVTAKRNADGQMVAEVRDAT